ncbi:MAG: divergent PAP2 family protein [Caldilineae bacterium]|nr:divergent PAP2 family protein [Chloroflexota bacterium]MCB9176207.1 divergent PAP2 family protein [Caldilineae bacterium]
MAAFWCALTIGLLVQGFKGVAASWRSRRVTLHRFFEPGGMPSAHSASVAALSSITGFKAGFGSPVFGVALYFSLIIMYDAAGLRRAAGRQAAILNRMLEAQDGDPTEAQPRLMELLGHSPLEVAIGALLGIGAAMIWHYLLHW